MVGEIILIDNNIRKTPPSLQSMGMKKLRYFPQEENIFVNPAWNLGVEEAHNHRICIVNDDVIFDFKVFKRIEHDLVMDHVGVMGLCPGTKEFDQPPVITGSINVINWTGQHTYGFGSLMFVEKRKWKPIPEGLKLYYGDNWIFDTFLAENRTNYLLTDMLFATPFAVTAAKIPQWDNLLTLEKPIFEDALAKFKEKILLSRGLR
jgi:hypothetical protein